MESVGDGEAAVIDRQDLPGRDDDGTSPRLWFHDDEGNEARILVGARCLLAVSHSHSPHPDRLEYVLLGVPGADAAPTAVVRGTVEIGPDGEGTARLPPECRSLLREAVYLVLREAPRSTGETRADRPRER